MDNKNYASVYGFVFLLIIGLMFFIYSSMLAIILNYTINLHGVLRRYIEQSANLLDGMHEGMIIISKVTKRTLFCNRPAQLLLKGALECYKKPFETSGSQDASSRDQDSKE